MGKGRIYSVCRLFHNNLLQCVFAPSFKLSSTDYWRSLADSGMQSFPYSDLSLCGRANSISFSQYLNQNFIFITQTFHQPKILIKNSGIWHFVFEFSVVKLELLPESQRNGKRRRSWAAEIPAVTMTWLRIWWSQTVKGKYMNWVLKEQQQKSKLLFPWKVIKVWTLPYPPRGKLSCPCINSSRIATTEGLW